MTTIILLEPQQFPMAEELSNGISIDPVHSIAGINETTSAKDEMDHQGLDPVSDPAQHSSSKDDGGVQNDSGDTGSVGGQPASLETEENMQKAAGFLEHIAKEVLEDSESKDKGHENVRHSLYPRLADNLLERERNKLELRRMQAMLYLSYSDLRIEQLETEVRNLRNAIGDLPKDFKVAAPTENPIFGHELKRSTLKEFEITQQSKNIPSHLRPALEVLVDHDPLQDPLSSATDATVHHTPRRLRIRPKLLAMHLARVTQQFFVPSNAYGLVEEEMSSSMVLIRPFKVLVVFEAAIRTSVHELEAKIQKKDTELSKPSEKAQEPSETLRTEYNDSDLLTDLKLLVEFLDIDLKSTFDLRASVKDGTAMTIEFPDLWHLFEPGEDVITQSTRTTMFRVVNFTVSLRLLLTLWICILKVYPNEFYLYRAAERL